MTDVLSKATPAELLKAYSRFAKEFPVETKTEAGRRLADAFATFLDEVADSPDVTNTDIRDDINAIMARNIVAVSMAFHSACVCFSCLGMDCEDLGNAVATQASGLDDRITKSAGMVH
ncbi:hypothetical protein [Rhizobium sp. AB2/73]|uniref:hypothetical protein n=1 Tax=Rhizobium sp. AB2/73 TaxID=2795216 RepID=UPI001C605131|nr:hypothetical protein [Rhizobium sp. AB2/73]QYA12964.1 hypothetical protein J5284_01555 [Rhizobium sp. AB2/73]UEQ81103.1 hypothetical protein I8E17_00760 [Rhizobium sp. AB2/73]